MSRTVDELVRDALGFAILERRDELGLSQLQIANRSGMSQTQISNFETAEQGCTIVQFWAVAKALEIAPGELALRTSRAHALLSDPVFRRIFWLGRARVRGDKLRR